MSRSALAGLDLWRLTLRFLHDDLNQLRRLPLSARDHSTGDLAVCQIRFRDVEVTRGHLERAKKFLTRRGIDLETLIFVITGVDRGLDPGAEEAGWLRMAQANRVV